MKNHLGIVTGSGLVSRCGLVSGSRLVDGSSLVDGSGLVDGGGLVSGCRLVSRCGLVSGSRLVFLSVARVLHISLVSSVSVSNSVSDSLGTTVGEEDAVFTVGSVSITRLFLVKVHTSIVIIDSVVISVVGGLFMVCRGGFVGGSIRGGGFVCGGGSVDVVCGGNSQESKSNKSLKYNPR